VKLHEGLHWGLLVNGVTGPPGSICGGSDPAEPCVVTRIELPAAPGPDLVLEKTASAEAVHPGGQLTYGLVVHNRGRGTATKVTVEDAVPSGVFFQSAHPRPGGSCTIAARELVCRLASLASGGQWLISVTATVALDAAGTLTNKATVFGAEGDPHPANGTASVSVKVDPLPGTDPGPQPVSSLVVRKHVSHAARRVGQQLTYTITVTNHGPDPARDVRVIDAHRLPLRVVSVHTARGSCQTGPPIRCRLETLPNGTHGTVTITAIATTAGHQANAAMAMSGSWNPDPAATVAATGTRITPARRPARPPRPRPIRPPKPPPPRVTG
jgi:uncharacterized repeat protein (TIGR01451 family)